MNSVLAQETFVQDDANVSTSGAAGQITTNRRARGTSKHSFLTNERAIGRLPAPGPSENRLTAESLTLATATNEEPSLLAFPIPNPPAPAYYFHALQTWEGTVTETRKRDFVARLRDWGNPQSPEKRATISFDEVSESDIPLVVPGGVFYWTLGYRVEVHGQKSLVSTIRFRRLPAWTDAEIEKARKLASQFDKLFRDGGEN